jgi:hypothetical protein
MKIKSQQQLEEILSNGKPIMPSLLFKYRLYFRLTRAINNERVSYFDAYKILAPKAFFSLLLMLLFATSGVTTLYAYYNPNIIKGDPLYGLKRVAEETQKFIAFTPEQKVDLFSTLATRRAKEAETLALRNGTIEPGVIQEITDNNNVAIFNAKSLADGESKTKSSSKIQQSSSEQTISLKKVKEVGVNKAKENTNTNGSYVDLDSANTIFLSAPITMDHISVRDSMKLESNSDHFGLVEKDNEKVVISGFLPEDEDITTEEEVVSEDPDLQLLDDVISKTESLSDSKNVDTLLQENNNDEDTFIN